MEETTLDQIPRKTRELYEKAMSANAVDYVDITDFEVYQPAENEPTAWMVTPRWLAWPVRSAAVSISPCGVLNAGLRR